MLRLDIKGKYRSSRSCKNVVDTGIGDDDVLLSLNLELKLPNLFERYHGLFMRVVNNAKIHT